MPDTLTSLTSVIHFAVFQASFSKVPTRTYVEIPPIKSLQSMESYIKWLENGNAPEMVARAFISIEILYDRLPMHIKRLITDSKYGYDESLLYFLKDSVISLVEILTSPPTPHNAGSEITTIDLQVLDIEFRLDTDPGLYVEVSHDENIDQDTEWWSDKDFPGSIIGHVRIEILDTALLEETKDCLKAMDSGRPEEMEVLIGTPVIKIIEKFLKA